MKLKKKYFVLFFGLIILLTTDNVFAKESIPYNGRINNTTLTDLYKQNNNSITFYTDPNNRTFSFSIHVEALYSTYQQTFVNYPYVIVFFKSGADELLAVRNGGCTNSCFVSERIQTVKMGKTIWQGYTVNQWALVLPVGKYTSYNWVGDWTTIPDYIDDTIVIGEYQKNNAVAFEFSSFVLADNIDFLDTYITSQSETSIWTNISNNLTNQFHDVIQAQEELQNIMGSEDWLNQLEQYNMMHQGTTQVNNAPISTLITMPLTFIEKLLDGFDSSCQSFQLGSLYGTNLTLPCIEPVDWLGSNVWGIIDVMISGLMIFAISKKCVRIFASLTELDDHDALKDMFGGED